MSRKTIVLAGVCLAFILSVAMTLRSRAQEPVRRPDNVQVPGEKLIAGYKQWTRVNDVPMLISSQAAALCAIALSPAGPHGPDKYITVYVNDIGRHAMMEEKTPRFPEGSVIIKEKFNTNAPSSTPELLTVMIKRERGYNPESGDWEYMVVDGSGRSVQARGKLENCQSCHKLAKESDYVSRSYILPALRSRLK